MADRLSIFTSKIQGIFRQPIRRVYGRIISNGHYKTNNVGVKNETNTASAIIVGIVIATIVLTLGIYELHTQKRRRR